MIDKTVQVQKPKRKISFYLLSILCVLFGASISTNNENWINGLMFGLIIITLSRVIFDKFKNPKVKKVFEIETHYDKLNSVVLAVIGIVMVSASVMNPNFMIKVKLDWINYMALGLILILSAFKIHKSLRLISKNSHAIEIENYALQLNSEIKQIQLFGNRMIISKSQTENYEFNELNICEEDKTKLTSWLQANLPNTQIEVHWNG